MKIPKKINICGHEWKINFVTQDKMEPTHIGECLFEDKEIRILKGLKNKTAVSVLLHEIRHAHHSETGMLQVLQHQAMEMDCDAFASLLTSLFHLRFKDQK